ncbi:MAG: recombinase zinc beta ribbon domain-containing protein, partial [Alphaproteobacteria bacterium]|nr:recombinase zinc beta ribbon domain-containing protein [Alphaproteobacteria bacterium]
RLARDIRVHWDLRDAINEYSAVMESPSATFGTDSDGRYFENIQALGAQHHREKNAEQTIKRQQARVIGGYWPFPASLGYIQERKEGHGKVMVPKEPLASIIREGMEGFAAGRFQTQAEVGRFFQSQPDFPKNRYGEVTNEAVNRILKRVIYSGYVKVDCWNIPLRKGKHEGLVSLETFERIQERLRAGAKIPVRSDINADFPLRGFILCDDCKNPMTACWSKSKTGKKHPYYMCFKKGCKSYRKSIPRAKIEADFAILLSSVQPSSTMFNLAKAMFKDAWNIQSEHAAAFVQSVKYKLHEIEKKITGLLDRIVDSSSESVIKAYEDRITALEKEKLVMAEKMQKRHKPQRSFDEMFELAIAFLGNPQKLW